MLQKIKNVYHLFIALAFNFIYFFPSRGIKVIGVTGTDGKTTTVSLIYHILKTDGKKTSMLTSIGAVIGDKGFDTGFHVTTPSSHDLQKIFRKARRNKTEYFVLEVTSHAIDQQRIFGIPFLFGVLTNVSNEHLDYHKTYDRYLRTKEKLLKKAKIAVVNKDDSSYTLLFESKNKKSANNWITYGLSESADVNPSNFSLSSVHLLGDFNKYNALAAIAVAKRLGIDEKIINKAISTFKLPKGRLDFYYDKDFSVIVDFAHTANAFEQLLSALKPIAKGNIIHVFGSAGERDTVKRPFMGEISSKYANIVILTSEDPRSEDPAKIIDEIASGINKEEATVIKIPNRKEAIEAAIQMAKKGDIVLLTGKSHEKSMTYGKTETPWSEYKVVDEAISSKNG